MGHDLFEWDTAVIFKAPCDICFQKYRSVLCYSSYIIACLPVCGDNSQALVSGLSPCIWTNQHLIRYKGLNSGVYLGSRNFVFIS